MKIFTSLLLVLLTSLPTLSVSSNDVEEKLTDPTRPNWFGLKKKQNSNGLVLNSLVMSPQRRIAVINGELMREGDTRGGVRVEQILADRVLVVTKNGNKRALKLPDSTKKTNNQKITRARGAEGRTR